MKKMIAALVLLVSSPAFSATWHTSTLYSVYPTGDGNFVMIFTASATACTNISHYHYVIAGQNGVNEEGVRKLYAAALTALAAGKAVNVNFDEASSMCLVNRMIVQQ